MSGAPRRFPRCAQMAQYASMDWGTVVTGVVGLAGIGGALLSASMTSKSSAQNLRTGISAEDERARRAEKRAIYAKYLAACDETSFAAPSHFLENIIPKRPQPREADERAASLYVAAVTANAELQLVAPAVVRELADSLQHLMVEGGKRYGDTKRQLLAAMRADLGEPTDGT